MRESPDARSRPFYDRARLAEFGSQRFSFTRFLRGLVFVLASPMAVACSGVVGAAGSPVSRRTVQEFVCETCDRRGHDDASCVVGCLAVWLLCGRAVG